MAGFFDDLVGDLGFGLGDIGDFIGVAADIAGPVVGFLGAQEQAKAAERGLNAANAARGQARTDLIPATATSLGAMYALADEFGTPRPNFIPGELIPGGGMTQGFLPGGDTGDGSAGRFSRFRASPGYQFRQDEAERRMLNQAGATGRRNSGATLKAIGAQSSNLASAEYGNYINSIQSLAGLTPSNQISGTNSVGLEQTQNALAGQGRARASSFIDPFNAVAQTVRDNRTTERTNQLSGPSGVGFDGFGGFGGQQFLPPIGGTPGINPNAGFFNTTSQEPF
jgi:hypothetical protein